jgi:hypothetical protein
VDPDSEKIGTLATAYRKEIAQVAAPDGRRYCFRRFSTGKTISGKKDGAPGKKEE